MKKIPRIIGALAGMLGVIPAQVRENLQLMKIAAVRVTTEAEAKGTAPDPHEAARALKRMNRKARRRLISHTKRTMAQQQPKESRAAFYRRRWKERDPKALRAAGHNARVRGH